MHEEAMTYYYSYRVKKIFEQGEYQSEAIRLLTEYLDRLIAEGVQALEGELLSDVQEFLVSVFKSGQYGGFLELIARVDWNDFLIGEITGYLQSHETQAFCHTREEYEALMGIAFQLFEEREYEAFLILLMKLQESEFFSKEILEDVKTVFVDPNLDQCRAFYIESIQALNLALSAPSFESLRYRILPTEKKNRYFLLDTEEDRIVDFHFEESLDPDKHRIEKNEDQFSDYLISGENSPFVIAKLLKKTNRKYYVVAEDADLFCTYLQWNISDCSFDNYDIRFFLTKEDWIDCLVRDREFLPRNHFSFDREIFSELEKLLLDVHRERIYGDREGVRPLLAIGIPTWNRGDFAFYNVLTLLSSEFDDEIEILVSDNHSDDETVIYYQRIAELPDRRVRYLRQEVNCNFGGNVLNVLEMARANYVLYTTDTDLIQVENLHRLLQIIRDEQEPYGEIHTSWYTSGADFEESEKGEEALLEYMLSGNLLSGLVYNAKLYREHRSEIRGFISKIQDNISYVIYAQLVLEMIFLGYGKMRADTLRTIIEYKGDGLKKRIDPDLAIPETPKIDLENLDKNRLCTFVVGKKKKVYIVYTYSIEGRIAQHLGFMEILFHFYDEHKDGYRLLEMHRRLYKKTLFLSELNLRVNYCESDLDIAELLERFETVLKACYYSLDKVYQYTQQKKSRGYEFCREEIETIYEYYKKQLIGYYQNKG